MQINIAACGLVCSQCDAYRATQENDREKLERVAADWRKRYQCDDILAESIPCDGCMTEGGRKCYHCGHACPIRQCVVAKKIATCGECGDYPCAVVNGFFGMAGAQAEAQEKLLKAIEEVKQRMHSAF